MGLALSTAWNGWRYADGTKIVQEIQELGFKEIELSFNLTPEMVKDIALLVKKQEIRALSLHNFCPIPEGWKRNEALPDCYSLASLDEEKRALALKYTKISIDTASALNARAVVLHCGRVEIKDRTRDLIFLYNMSRDTSLPQILDIKDTMQRERQDKAKAHLSAALKSIEELSIYARKSNIALGVENRFYFREIPSFEEIAVFLNSFRGANVFYWHDTGHAQLWDNLAFTRHQDYLNRYGQDLLGMHIHDIQGAEDHLAPLKGNLNFELFKPYLKENTIKTIEAHHPAQAQDIIKAREFLEKLYER